MPDVPWSPVAWWRAIVRNWQSEGPVERRERRGYWFWGPTILIILAVELLGALSSTFKNKIPWPTISATVGHLEKRWDWVGVIVVGDRSGLLVAETAGAPACAASTHDSPVSIAPRAIRRRGPKRSTR